MQSKKLIPETWKMYKFVVSFFYVIKINNIYDIGI